MDVAFEERLRREMRTSAEAMTVADDLPGRVDRRVRGRRRQSLGVRAAAGIIAAAALAAGVVVSRDDGGATETMAAPVGSPAEGTWEPLPEAPISARFQQAAVWTGDEMIVFGGHDGDSAVGGAAAYSPATGAWRPLADPPAGAQGAPVAVWTGTEVVAFGGPGDEGVEGAIYDPQADEWRPVATPAPGALGSFVTHAAWTGEQVVVAGTSGTALYDPATGDWTQLPAAPDALPEGDAVWTGQEMVFVGHDEGSGARAPQRLYALALDPTTAEWRTLPAPPLTVRGQPLVAWTGSEIVVGGGHDFASPGIAGDHADAAAFDPASGTWRTLSDAPVNFQGNDRYGDVAVDGRIIAFETADPDGRVLVLDPAAGWQLAPGPDRPELTAPDELPGRREAPPISTGGSVLLWGGGVARNEDGGAWGCCRPVGEGEVFTPPLQAG